MTPQSKTATEQGRDEYFGPYGATDATREGYGIGGRSAFSQFAIDAAHRQVARVSGLLNEAADSIDDLADREDSALPEPIKGLAASASNTMRELAERAGAQDAGRLVQSLQRQATANPVATAGIGAAIGAALGLALVRLGRASDAT